MAAKDRHTQTQEKLQTNGDTNGPKDSSVHLLPLDQKVKDTASKRNQPRLGSLGLLCRPRAAAQLYKETEGRKEPISPRKLSWGPTFPFLWKASASISMNHCWIIQ